VDLDVENGNVAFHLNPRFKWAGADVNYIIAFTYEAGRGWHSDLGPRSRVFPFALNKDVEIRIGMLDGNKWFEVYIDGEYSFKYENQLGVRFVDYVKFGSVSCDLKVYRAFLNKNNHAEYDLF
jgi:hypothetical protein